MSPAAFAQACVTTTAIPSVGTGGLAPLPSSVLPAPVSEIDNLQYRLKSLRDDRDSHQNSIKQVIYLRTYIFETQAGRGSDFQHWAMFNTQLPTLDDIQMRRRSEH